MIQKIISSVFSITILLFIASFFEKYTIITFNDLHSMSINKNISNIAVEKYKKYALFELNKTKVKLDFYSFDHFNTELNKHNISDEVKNNIIFMEENEPNYLYIFITLIILSTMFGEKGKDFSDRLVSDMNLLVNQKSKVKFNNIAGLHEVKEDIKEYINFVNNKKKYLKLNAKLPKGILLSGPPGCGKTLIAKAIAGETGINLFAISASDFNEIFVGVGAKRIRKLFTLARENTPSIIFIDEIDSIGLQRGGQFNREYDTVLNKILVEMDGFTENEDVIVFAATNRIQDLDPALLRSGRFDRKIIIDYPNKDERVEIIKYYFDKKPLGDKIIEMNNYFHQLSKLTSGLSGADIENIANYSAIHAVKNNREKIEECDILEALDEIMIGIKKKERIMTPNERNIVAHHEVGHAIIAYLLKDTNPPIKLSIVPRGENILGFSQQDQEDKKLYTKDELLAKVCVLLGGRLTEEVFFGKEDNGGVTNGAYDDIEKITKILHSIYFEYGMINEKLNYTEKKYLSETLLNKLNTEMEYLLKNLNNKTKNIIEKNKENITTLANQLLENEILYCNDLEKILGINNKNSIR
jgi:ATP-dependent metalloprotease FtsH